ncbi:MAG: helix-turn-helix transcriptional regulator [Oscillospiraceae bacterium]|jgi:DNA-binding HxlR family transcriptional regulator|nr:helix-turn-helix transcriptional regulator [Oscillospiraceae bacterium]
MKTGSNSSNLFGICPYVTTQKLLSGKWTIMILYFLSEHKCRFNELSKKINGVTQSALTKQLRSLELAGLIERTVFPEIPIRVEYQLSELGHGFSKVLTEIEQFGNTYNAWLAESKQRAHEDKAEMPAREVV